MSASLPPDPPSSAPKRVGRYLLFDEIARGGMASVHLARLVGAAGFSRVVAVKRLRQVFVDSEEHRRALMAEAKLTARIRHPNVVPVIDTEIVEGVAHVVMEYVHGVTLARLFQEHVARGERVPEAIAIGVAVDALMGLHAAHEQRDATGTPLGIVHRDVSPQNVQVGADGHARLLDFGIAKVMGATQVTAPGTVKGKIAYMPREQIGGGPLTRQADVYAMGVVLWELLAGKRLFEDDEAARLATRVLTEDVPPPGASPALDAIVLRATSHDARRRFATADEMAAALLAASPRADAFEIAQWVERLAGDELELRAETVRRVEGAEIPEPPSTSSSAPPPPPIATRSRATITAVAVALALLAIAAGAWALRPKPVDPAPTTAAVVVPAAPVPLPLPDPSPPDTAAIELDDAPPRPTTSAATPARAHVAKRRPAANPCDPPYSIDAAGRKHYKPGCLP